MVDLIEVPYNYCGHNVSGIWRYMLPKAALDFKLPKERRATCSSCPMSRFDGHHKLYRCCTYHPIVPNFLLGLSLKQKRSYNAVNQILQKGYLLPEGFQRTPQQWIQYLGDLAEERYNENVEVRCPLLDKDEGLCNIYGFRNAVCSTFFCLNDHGDKGNKFWESLEEMISQMEAALAQWAMDQLGFSTKAYFERLDSLTDKIHDIVDPNTLGWNAKTRKFLWDNQFGKELEFFKKCGKLISDHRDELWDIAEDVDILEAPKFERKQVEIVPKGYQHEIDPEDLEIGTGETAKVSDLWDDVKSRYKRLWKVPKTLKLSKHVEILDNPKDDKESRAFKAKPYVVQLLDKKDHSTYEWREFVSEPWAKALKHFKKDREVSKKLLAKPLWKDIEDPMGFLSEWSSKKVLTKP